MKKILFFITVFVMSMVIMPNVNAKYEFEQDLQDQKEQIERKGDGTEGNPYVLTLQKDAVQDIEIEAGKHVVIDLAGHKLTNYCTSCSAIWIKDATAVVTIKDSSNGAGEIELKSSAANEVPLIKNEGTLIVEGGTIKSNNDYSGANKSTGIYNAKGANLTINGGNIETASDYAWGITNLGTAFINGGTFNQNKKLAMIMNSADLTINDGTFKSSGEEGQEGMITNDKGEEGTPGVSTLKIMGGNFQVDNVINEIGDGTTTINGGKFQNPENIVKYLAEGLIINENGIVVKPINATPEEQPKNEANPNTSDINLYLLLSLIAVSGLGITYTVKKRFN